MSADDIEKFLKEVMAACLSDGSLKEKIFVAVAEEFEESKSVLMWALQNSPRSKKFVLAHVHCPDKMIPTSRCFYVSLAFLLSVTLIPIRFTDEALIFFVDWMFRAGVLTERLIASRRQLDREKLNKTLSRNLECCEREQVKYKLTFKGKKIRYRASFT